VGQDEVEPGEVQGPSHLAAVQLVSLSEIRQVLMICCKRDNWVEPHQNPSYKSINQGLAKWALATCELMHAMRVVNVEDELG